LNFNAIKKQSKNLQTDFFMTCGVFVRVKDFQKLMGFNSYCYAQRKFKYIRESLKKEDITINELCSFLKITVAEYHEHTK
jgi:hypothetical protein